MYEKKITMERLDMGTQKSVGLSLDESIQDSVHQSLNNLT